MSGTAVGHHHADRVDERYWAGEKGFCLHEGGPFLLLFVALLAGAFQQIYKLAPGKSNNISGPDLITSRYEFAERARIVVVGYARVRQVF